MGKKFGVSGMGRIGRLLVRKMLQNSNGHIELKAINASYPANTIAHLLKYDTIHGKWDADIAVDGDYLIINGHAIRFFEERDPSQIPWGSLGIDIVFEATGKFTEREEAAKHLKGGARKVIITAPGKNSDATIVMGVNEHTYIPEKHQIVSAASCTTNCLSPVLKIMDDAFSVRRGWMTTVHSYTNDQRHLDNPHKDLRRARACTQSIVPTSTGVGKALKEVLPHLSSSIHGLSIRVPTQDVSLMDLTLEVAQPVTEEKVRQAFVEAAQGPMQPYVEFCEEPLVSSDFIGNEKSAVIDGLSLMVKENQIKILAWYDNEWGYASRVVDLAEYMSQKELEKELEACSGVLAN